MDSTPTTEDSFSDKFFNSLEDVAEAHDLRKDICPYKLEWSFGMNPDVPLVNLTTGNRTLIAFACSHIAIMYDYRNKKMLPLQGHQNSVKTLSASGDGKWLLTADFDQDCVVVVWNTESKIPICTLFNPHGIETITAACISPNAKYIVTMGNERYQKVHFWLWTYGQDKPDATSELIDVAQDRIKEISFNNELSEEFVLTGDSNVLFFSWIQGTLSHYHSKIPEKQKRFGIFNSSIYISKTFNALTATANGYVLIWSSNYGIERTTLECEIVHQEKKYMKSIKLGTCSINVILDYDGMVVTGDSYGRINFYDNQLSLLYWFKNNEIDSIKSISFDLRSTAFSPLFVNESNLEHGYKNTENESGHDVEGICGEDLKCQGYCNCTQKSNDTINVRSDRILSNLATNIERIPKTYSDEEKMSSDLKTKSTYTLTDCTVNRNRFIVDNFFICTLKGAIALMDIQHLKCYFMLHSFGAPITSLDAHPESPYFITGDKIGNLCLYNSQDHNLVFCGTVPILPDFHAMFDNEVINKKVIYVTCPHTHKTLTAVTALKYAPTCDMLVCGLEGGVLWILHPFTLEPLDKFPYKHSSQSICNVVFTKCSTYMAYFDDALCVAVFSKNVSRSEENNNFWNFIGKYQSHLQPIIGILFGPFFPDTTVPRFFSLGEDRDFIEYDLRHSGPYPNPGLKIMQVNEIESRAIPLCIRWYPTFGIETFFVISNSEYKYRLLNDTMKMIRGTFLGPIYDTPVQNFMILPKEDEDDHAYMIFATTKEIGLQLLPLNGNPYNIVGMIGHPRKITGMTIGNNGDTLLTMGLNDQCVLMWKINFSALEAMSRLGGEGLSPFYCLIEGGREGWLMQEMKDLFYYAQILHQGEKTVAPRIISDKVSIEQISNLMRAVGFYPSNKELENITSEVAYRDYAVTGQLLEEISFENLVKLFINHRPALGYSTEQIETAFINFSRSMKEENPSLTRGQFLDIIFGKDLGGNSKEDDKLFGEPLTFQEAQTYLRLLVPSADDAIERHKTNSVQESDFDFDFVPARISYKDFITDILGVELANDANDTNDDNKELI